MNKIKSFFRQAITNSRINMQELHLLGTAQYDTYVLHMLKMLIIQLKRDDNLTPELFFAKGQRIINCINPNKDEVLSFNESDLQATKIQYIEILKNQPRFVLSYLNNNEFGSLDGDLFIAESHLKYNDDSNNKNIQNTINNNTIISIKKEEYNTQNNFITSIDYDERNKEKEVIKKTSKIKVEISKEEILKKAIDFMKIMSFNIKETGIFSSILFDLEIIEKHKNDIIENRLKILGNILGKKVSYNNRIKYFDPKLSKNELKIEKELMLLIKDFFIENPFKESINHIDLLIKRIDNIINPKKRNP